MGTEIDFTSARWLRDMDGTWLCLKISNDRAAMRFIDDMVSGKTYEAELKQKRKKRSLDANCYCWVLLDKLAAALGRTKDDLYLDYIKKVGVFKDFSLTEEEAKTFSVAWSKIGTGWPVEQVDFTPDGERVILRAYYGSSTYNTKQMSRLIDAVVEDCREMGIETLTPFELDAMKERWRGKGT